MNTLSKGLAVVLALTLGFFASDIYNALQSATPDAEVNYCELSTVVCERHGVSMVLGEDVVKAMQPTTMEVNWPNSKQKQLLIELEGKEMSMGVAKFVLEYQSDDRFVGTLLLPVCFSDSMTWIGTISASGNDNHDRNDSESVPILVRMQK
jgi:hypothetical protein